MPCWTALQNRLLNFAPVVSPLNGMGWIFIFRPADQLKKVTQSQRIISPTCKKTL